MTALVIRKMGDSLSIYRQAVPNIDMGDGERGCGREDSGARVLSALFNLSSSVEVRDPSSSSEKFASFSYVFFPLAAALCACSQGTRNEKEKRTARLGAWDLGLGTAGVQEESFITCKYWSDIQTYDSHRVQS